MQRIRKTVTLLAIGLMAAATPSFGQGLSIGAKVGATFATVGGDGVQDAGNRTGLSIGAFTSIGVSPMFSLQPELLLVQKGTSADDGTATGSFNFSYLEIPVLARISFPAPGALKPYLFVGPSASFKMGCSISGESQGVTVDSDCESLEDFGVPSPKGFDFGFIGGLGAGMPLGAGQATLDVRYDLGLSNIYDGVDTSVKNRAFTIMLGYSIGLGG